jgi:hypothetical protein
VIGVPGTVRVRLPYSGATMTVHLLGSDGLRTGGALSDEVAELARRSEAGERLTAEERWKLAAAPFTWILAALVGPEDCVTYERVFTASRDAAQIEGDAMFLANCVYDGTAPDWALA